MLVIIIGAVIQTFGLPMQVGLGSVQEMSWMQESHRLRLLTIANERLQDPAFLAKLFKLENMQGLNAKDIEDFKQFTLFRIANHDFKKGTFTNSLGLSRIKGLDIAKLSGQEQTAAKSIVNAVNDSGWFIEHQIHDFIFERDDNGKLLTGAEKLKRQKLSELSAHFEHALDLHDRHMAAQVSTEWNRPMKKGSAWIDELVNNLSTKGRWAEKEASKEYEVLRSTKKVSQFIEKEIDGSHYRTMTKGISAPEYMQFRRSRVALDYSDILQAKRLAVNPPRVLKPFLPKSGVINQTNVETITQKIVAFSGRNKFRVGAAAGRFASGAGKIVKGLGRIAIPAEIAYGAYVFAQSGDLGKGVGASLGISEAGASDETSLYNPSQQKLFFSLARSEQERLLRTVPDFTTWFENQFLEQPLETQIGLLCQDSSLAELFNIACVREIKCTGGEISRIDIEPVVSEAEKQITVNYSKDALRGKSQINSIEIISQGVLKQKFNIRSKEKLSGVSKSNKAIKHWILVNRGAIERSCQYDQKNNKTSVLSPQIVKETQPENSAFNILLGYLNQSYQTENPEMQTENAEVQTHNRESESAQAR